MKITLTILSLWFCAVQAQTTYYVSNTGSDANNGTSTVTAWQTITKVNSITFVPGDQILLNDANTWVEPLRIKSSGSTQSIKIGRYGVGGVKPAITGFKTALLTNAFDNVWSGYLPDAANNLNVVKVNGTIAAKARYPNTGYLQATSVLNDSSLRIPHDAVNRVGSEIVMMSYPWVLDVAKITSHNTGISFDTLKFTNVRNGGNGLYYFYQNATNQLDTLNEWTFDNITKLLSVVALSQPVVEYSTIDTLVDLHKKSSIIIDGISLTGANSIAVRVDSTRNDTIKNSSLNNNYIGFFISYLSRIAFVNDSIQNSLSQSYFSYGDTSLYISGNYFNNTGMLAGMGGNGFSTYGGGYNQGNNAVIQYNQFLNSGYHGFRWSGKNNFIYRNYVDGFCNVKNDGGGIYTFAGLGNNSINSGSVVRENIIKNGYGNVYGGNYSVGIYLDDYVDSITVEGNTIANVLYADIQTKGTGHVIRYNTFYDSVGINARLATNGIRFTNNILYNANYNQENVNLDNTLNDFGTIDSNYYIIAQYQSFPMKGIHFGSGKYTFAQWQALKPELDVNSISAYPSGISSVIPILKYNLSSSTVVQSLSGTYYNERGVTNTGGIALPSYKSALLFKATTDLPQSQKLQKLKIQKIRL